MVAKLKVDKGLSQKEAFKMSGEIWKSMSDKEKAKYVALQKKDEERYQKQLRDFDSKGFFILDDGRKSIDVKQSPKSKYGPDVVLPKKPLSSYICYTTDNVLKVRDRENIKHTEAMKKCGEMWNNLTEKERKKYDDLHMKDVKRYDKQMLELDKRGFFVMTDGSKSSDHVPKIKKRRVRDDEEDKTTVTSKRCKK